MSDQQSSPVDPELLKMLVEADLQQHPPEKPKAAGLSKLSTASLIGGQAADAASTLYALQHGAREANPALGSQPSAAKLLAMKGAGTAGSLLLLKLLAKKNPKAANLTAKVLGGVMGGVAAHNLTQTR